MMKKLLFYIAFTLTAGSGFGQGDTARSFFFIGEKGLYKMEITKSAFTIYSGSFYSFSSFPREQSFYSILATKTSGQYQLYYIEEKIELGAPQTASNRFKIIYLKYTSDGQTVEMLSEATAYASLAECEKASPADPDSKFLITYYSRESLQACNNWRKIGDLDSVATDEFLRTFKEDIDRNKQRIANTDIIDLNGSIIGRELFTRTMMKAHINPLVSEEEIGKKIRNSPIAKELGMSAAN
jgi:hypothetical protein